MSNVKLLKSILSPLRLCFLLILSFATAVNSENAMAQQKLNVKGKVISSTDGMGLPGVSVQDTGNPKNGVVTDVNGNYQINLSSEKSALKFSYLGFKSQQILSTGKTVINVSLDEDKAKLDEVVVVGYGQQKKINSTGASETVRFDDAVNTPVTNSAQLMYGKFSGVQITQASGLPGSDGSAITIRGLGTFGSSNPLVVIDNIQYIGLEAFNNLSPSDIESVSVLKDASAGAIYGARGSNGVIIVTTKKGKAGSMSVSYNGYTGFQDVTVVPQYLNAVNYATLLNEYNVNLNGANAPVRYSPANIQAIIDGSNPDQYANTNWASEILRTAPIQNHYLSFSGGNERTTFRLSVGYLNQQAVVRGKFQSERYNLSLNLNSKMNKWLELSNVTNTYWKKFKGPSGGANAITGETGIINQFQRSSPTIPAYYSNGDYGIVDGSYQNVNFSYPNTNALRTGVLGDNTNDDINLAERLGAKINFTKELSFETSGALNLSYGNVSNFNPTSTTYDYAGAIVGQNLVNSLTNSTTFDYKLLNENILRYAKVFNKKHDFSILVGQSASYERNDGFSASAQGFPSNFTQEFDAGGVLNPSVGGRPGEGVDKGASEDTYQSFFGRLNYSYGGKYLFEANLRRDGFSRFGPGYREGNFPSISAGWRISEEKFLKKVNWISELKLRGSWGINGNGDIDRYIYDQNLNTSLDYTLGNGIIVNGVAQTALANKSVRWESVEQYDIGLDADLFKNGLSVTADYFNRRSYDILYKNFPVPATIGVTNIAAQNAANMLNKGLEVSLNYRGKFKELNYSVGGNFTNFADNKVTSLGENGNETINGESIIKIGVPFNAIYGYKVVGIFQTAAEVAAAPQQFGSVKTAPGDFQYADLSGPNGVPDGKIDALDRTVIGNPFPKWTYGFNANANYKLFDLSLVLQGVQRVDRLLNDNGQQPFPDGRNNALSYWVNRWTPTNPSTTLPRVGGDNNTQLSDFYVQDCSFLRLKNLELGYTMPTLFTQKYGVSKVRIYVGAQNLLTFTKMKNFDPERQRGGNTDQLTPLYKVYTFGLNLKF
nr:TonB-dependent receptor [uncultured Pedobacter sp.]